MSVVVALSGRLVEDLPQTGDYEFSQFSVVAYVVLILQPISRQTIWIEVEDTLLALRQEAQIL
ncbi:MAG: hypothetical protein WBV18_12820 [Methyloceanibacter sp.]|uniref:hypothetical protein n=1 Tax=Methyloceanibacter sp. TaxID=1965321 RepID=UPI003C5CA6B9